ncbi:MAG: ABC transporter ATP-binding protein, partial [Salibacteraceae bacterium]
AAFRTLPSFNRILASLMGLKAGEFIYEIMDNFEKEMKKSPTNKVAHNEESIVFKSLDIKTVSHRYAPDSKVVLSNVDFRIESGDLIAVVGPSGSGKTTFMNILIGLLKPESGILNMNDEIELVNDNMNSLWSILGYVRQDAFMLDATIEENLALSDVIEIREREGMINVLEMVGLSEFATNDETGLQRPVGEGGGLLSGGQRQRLSIARALYSGAGLIVYDEPTSSIDSASEQKVNETILKLRDKGVAQVIISHKPSILEFCDRVYEIKNGVLIEKNKTP